MPPFSPTRNPAGRGRVQRLPDLTRRLGRVHLLIRQAVAIVEMGKISFGDPEQRVLRPPRDLMLADLCEALEKGIPVTCVPRIPRLYEGRIPEWPVR